MPGAFVNGHVYLDDRATLLAVASELVGEDAAKWKVTVSSWPEANPPGPARWRIEVNDHRGNPPVVADLGDHLVIAYGRLLRLSDAEFKELNPET